MLAGWPELKGKQPNKKNWCSLFFLAHLYRLFPIKRAYQLEEIAPSELSARELVDEAERLWMKYADSNMRLWKSMFEQFWGYVLGIGLMCLGKVAIGGAVGLVVLDFFIISFDRMYVGFSMFLSMRVRVVITGLIYRKLMKTKVSALQFTSDGQLSNFVGADVERLFLCIMPMQYVWVSPVILLVVVAIIYVQCGSEALVGYVGVAILLIIQGLPVKVMGYFRLKSAVLGDKRLALTNEAIEAIHLIKACVWESAISQHIDKARWLEVKAKIYQSCCEAVKDVFTNINRLVVLIFVTLIWTIIGEEITSSTIFPLSSLYSTSCTWFPSNFIWGLQDVIYAKVSMKRVQEFLELSDMEADDTVSLETGGNFDNPIYPDSGRRPMQVHNVEEVMVRDSNGTLIDLGPKSGKLIGLAGSSASGKTTFMKDLMGFRKGGTIQTIKTSDGRIGYAPQSAWIFPATLRENILAGLPFQSQRYWDVIRACCLDEDLRNLKFGDQTRVGFGGITLSGGQQARVSLARAVYSNADIYVIDDPFSAINQKIAKRIFKLCFQQYLEGKTRLVVLHEDSFLSSCDHTIIFPITGGPGSGENVVSGTEHSHQDYAARKLNQLLSESENEADVLTDIERRRQRGDAYTYGMASASEAEGADGRSRGGRRRFSPQELSKKMPDGDSPLYHKFGEELSKSVSWKIYWRWCKAANPFIVALLFCNFAGARALVNISDLWLTSWTGDDCTDSPYTEQYYDNATGECNTTLMNWYYFKHYVVLVLSALCLAIPLGMGWRIAFMLAADRVHRKMIRSTLRTPMKVIMEKSYGEISNRFSRDVNGVDWVVIFMSFSFLDGFSSIISYLVIILMMNTYVLIGLVPAVGSILIIRMYYLRCTRQIARLEAEAKSPYFTHFNTSFNGLPTARALKLEANMVTDFHKFQNVFISVVSVFLDMLLWLDLMVGICGVFFMAVVCFCCLLIAGLSSSSSSTVGLVLMYTLTLLENMQKNVRESAEVDNKMVHTERCLEFTNLPREEPDRGNQEKPKEDDEAFSSIRPFPIRNGQINAQRVHLRYSIDSPWVLKDFNLDIQPAEKIGLAGRTGCGKSSFLNVILRMYEYDGVVLVDGTDIKGLSLASLRKGVSIMTQFPIIFSMTLRQNLDPNQTTRDDEMWRALEMVGLKDLVLRMPQGIDSEITPHALEWSAGQKQLFCMARTLLEGRKIVLMDEPTSSLDNVTGKLLWDKCVEVMKDCTVIIVSHMPSQLTFCNRIINMDAKADASL